jgi:predicted  nucleic acid-binding Zn-ribbon protein
LKRCTYCGRENSDEALRCRECGINQFEGAAPLEHASDDALNDRDVDLFKKNTDLPLSDAKKFLERLEQEGIQFKLVPLGCEIQQMDAFTASVGGSFGTATTVRILTRLEDDMRVAKIWREFCGF